MLKTLVLVLLAACVADPPASTDQMFSCETVAFCEDVETKDSREACGTSREDVESAWVKECSSVLKGHCFSVRCEVTCYPEGLTCPEAL